MSKNEGEMWYDITSSFTFMYNTNTIACLAVGLIHYQYLLGVKTSIMIAHILVHIY